VDLRLDSNEGANPPADLLQSVLGADVLRRYPDIGPLERLLAQRLGVDADQVVATAGADDAIDRACRAVLCAGRELVVPVPGFEMVLRYARQTGASVVTVPWDQPAYPTQLVLDSLSSNTAMIVVTSPNNPTGGVATADDLRALAEAAPQALLLVDLAYAEFADEDLTEAALALPQALVIRTLSKAWGLAGLRVGYAAGPSEVIGWLRAVGPPYAVSGVSAAAALVRVQSGEEDMAAFVRCVRAERARLEVLMGQLGLRPSPSQANFVFAECADPVWLRDGMAGLGIAIRAFPGKAGLERRVRIGCPGDSASFDRLCAGLRTVTQPQALLLDIDGVLADVTGSYDQAIVQTAAAFGVVVSAADVAAAKANGDANNDWVLTWRLIGTDARLEDVTECFERLYNEQLWRRETLIPSAMLLRRLAARMPLAAVTGRPRRDLERFLDLVGLDDLFSATVTMEDAPAKPDPAPVRLALQRLGLSRAWMVGDTPDDARAARAAGVLPLGFGPVQGQVQAGAARVLDSLEQLESLLDLGGE